MLSLAGRLAFLEHSSLVADAPTSIHQPCAPRGNISLAAQSSCLSQCLEIMDQRERQSGLIGAAERCERELLRFKQHAQEKKASKGRRVNTARLLDKVIDHNQSSIFSLRAWRRDVSNGTQTTNPRVINDIESLFEQLTARVAQARKVTDRRLGLRLRRLFPGQKLVLGLPQHCPSLTLCREKARARLNAALTEITSTIGYLQGQIDIILTDSNDMQQRQTRISRVRDRPQFYNVFLQNIRDMSQEERRMVRFGSLNFLWQEMPEKLELGGKIGNLEDPGDGIVYNIEEIGRVETILRTFYEAWSEVSAQTLSGVSGSLPKVGDITNMCKICLILHGMKQERFFDYFCEHGKTNIDLPMSEETIRRILPNGESYWARIFHAEQYRVVCRHWDDGEAIEIDDAEPLPLITTKPLGTGSFGKVSECRHAFTKVYYAHKEQNVLEKNRAHLETEIELLKKFQHVHIIQYVKSYRRGSRCGLLLCPVADGDLKKLLVKYHNNLPSIGRGSGDQRKDRKVFRPVIMTAFGCLSRGLAHIHHHQVRHKDIKPANILFVKEQNGAPARFLWADFGLGYDFEDQEHSRTISGSIYSPRYAAPEVMESSAIGAIGRTPAARDSNDLSGHLHPLYQSSRSNERPLGTGRPSDVFSFGLVFLEVLSHLIDEQHGLWDREEFEACTPFHKNIVRLQAWAAKEADDLPHAKASLRVLFQIGATMVTMDETARPLVDDIVRTLRAAGPEYFCSHCLGEVDPPGLVPSSLGSQATNIGTSECHVDGPTSVRTGGSEAADVFDYHQRNTPDACPRSLRLQPASLLLSPFVISDAGLSDESSSCVPYAREETSASQAPSKGDRLQTDVHFRASEDGVHQVLDRLVKAPPDPPYILNVEQPAEQDIHNNQQN